MATMPSLYPYKLAIESIPPFELALDSDEWLRCHGFSIALLLAFPSIKYISCFYDEEQLYIHIKSLLKKSLNSTHCVQSNTAKFQHEKYVQNGMNSAVFFYRMTCISMKIGIE